jgi:hypothetical protein
MLKTRTMLLLTLTGTCYCNELPMGLIDWHISPGIPDLFESTCGSKSQHLYSGKGFIYLETCRHSVTQLDKLEPSCGSWKGKAAHH